MNKILLLVLLLVALNLLRRSSLWENILSDPRVRKSLMILGGICAWGVVVLVCYALIYLAFTLFDIFSRKSMFAGIDLIRTGMVIAGIVLGIQTIYTFASAGGIGDFRTLFFRLLLFRVSEHEHMDLDRELKKMRETRIE